MTRPAQPAPKARPSARARLAALGAGVFCAGLCGAAALFLLSDAQVLELTRDHGELLGRVRAGTAEAVMPIPLWRWAMERAVDGCLALGGLIWLGAAGAGVARRILFGRGARGAEGRGEG